MPVYEVQVLDGVGDWTTRPGDTYRSARAARRAARGYYRTGQDVRIIRLFANQIDLMGRPR